MNELIPTRVVDRNGRLTTVHKKAPGSGTASSSLKSIKPLLPGATTAADNTTHTIKGKVLHAQSLSLQLLSSDEPQQYRLTKCAEEFEWRKSVDMPDDELYRYLSHGVDSQDAAALHGLGVTPDELPDHPSLAVYLPGRLGRFDGQESYQIVSNRKVIERFQAAGISALDAEKAIANKVQDRFLDKALDDYQLLQLFTKKKCTLPHGMRMRVNDRVTYSFVTGRLPMTVLDIPSKNLSDISSEVMMMGDGTFSRISSDKHLYEKIIRKAAESTTGKNSVESLHIATAIHGPKVLDLNDPFLCSMISGSPKEFSGGLKSVQFIDRVYQLIKGSGRSHGDNHPYEWWGGYYIEGISVKSTELEKLRLAGLTPDEAFDGIVLSRLSIDQMIVAHEDNVPQSLANGAL